MQQAKSGLVVRYNDATGLAEAVIILFNDKKLAIKLGINGRKYVLENLTPEKIGEKMYTILSLKCN